MITYSADSHVLYGELYHWPAGTWPAGTMMDIYEWDTGKYMGKIPQAAQTYNVIGNMNEYQLAIGETTYGGRKELESQPGAIIDYGSLIYITLQRAKNAREAIVVMTDLVERYGYASSGESFSISDPDEVWILEMIGKGEGEKGAVWVARMVPDGYVCAHANQARITTFPLEGKTSISSDQMKKIYDKEITTVYAKDVISFAKQKGLYPQDGKNADFSFSDTYAPVDFSGARACEIRVWAFFNAVNPDMAQYWNYAKGKIERDGKGYATNRMPLWVKPNRKVDVLEVMDFMRDHLEGTELDMSKDPGAGPYECPYRWRPMSFEVDGKEYVHERATATQQTGFTFVSQSRSWLPDAVGGILWFGVDDAASTVYFPMYSCSTRVPHAYAVGNGSMMEFTDQAAFWVFNQVTNFAYTRYNAIHPEIREKQKALESQYKTFVEGIDSGAKALFDKDRAAAIEFLTDFSCNTGNHLVDTWRDFYGYLFCRYMDGNIKTAVPGEKNPKVEQPQLPEWYLRTIIEKAAKVGDALSTGSDLCTIYDLSYLEMTINVDELQVSSLKVGQSVQVTADAVKDKTYEGLVTRVSMKGDTSGGTTTYPVTVRIDETDGLRPGMNANAEIVVAQAKNALTVPNAAIVRGGYVLVRQDSPSAVNADDSMSAPEGYVYVKVKTGVSDDNYTQVTSGLSESDTIAYDPSSVSSDSYYDDGGYDDMDGEVIGGAGNNADLAEGGEETLPEETENGEAPAADAEEPAEGIDPAEAGAVVVD